MSRSTSSHGRGYELALGVILVLAWLAAAPVAAAEVDGAIHFTGRQSKSADPRNVVIQFTPDQPVRAADRPPERPFIVTTVRKDFSPRVIAVPTGTAVRFPNNDTILHNVFSVTKPNAFDLGLYGRGEGEKITFAYSGVVRVYCNVHPQMVAYVVVVGDTPFITYPDADGRFRLEGIPSGGGTLNIWHQRADGWSRRLTLPSTAFLDVELELTRARLPSHLNKFGKRYARRRGRRY